LFRLKVILHFFLDRDIGTHRGAR